MLRYSCDINIKILIRALLVSGTDPLQPISLPDLVQGLRGSKVLGLRCYNSPLDSLVTNLYFRCHHPRQVQGDLKNHKGSFHMSWRTR